jgi:hypothetical protein
VVYAIQEQRLRERAGAAFAMHPDAAQRVLCRNKMGRRRGFVVDRLYGRLGARAIEINYESIANELFCGMFAQSEGWFLTVCANERYAIRTRDPQLRRLVLYPAELISRQRLRLVRARR